MQVGRNRTRLVAPDIDAVSDRERRVQEIVGADWPRAMSRLDRVPLSAADEIRIALTLSEGPPVTKKLHEVKGLLLKNPRVRAIYDELASEYDHDPANVPLTS